MAHPTHGAFHPTTLEEGLSAWIILFKDILKRVLTAQEEAQRTLTSLAFLRVYERDGGTHSRGSGGRKAPQLFRTAYRVLVQIVGELRRLFEEIRDDLVTIELLLLPHHTYEDLTSPALDSSPHQPIQPVARSAPDGPVLPYPGRFEGYAAKYVAALRVLWTTGLHDSLEGAKDALPTIFRGEGALDPKIFGADETRWSLPLRAMARWLFGLVSSFEGGLSSSPGLHHWVEFVICLQEQPYCQAERFADLEARARTEADVSKTNEDLATRFADLFRQTVTDGRFADLFPEDGEHYAVVQSVMETALSGKSASLTWLDILRLLESALSIILRRQGPTKAEEGPHHTGLRNLPRWVQELRDFVKRKESSPDPRMVGWPLLHEHIAANDPSGRSTIWLAAVDAILENEPAGPLSTRAVQAEELLRVANKVAEVVGRMRALGAEGSQTARFLEFADALLGPLSRLQRHLERWLPDPNEELRWPTMQEVWSFTAVLANASWQRRRNRTLRRLAQLQSGDVPEVESSVLHAIHGDFFRRVQRYHEGLARSLDVLQHTLRTIQQRSALLPPSFPQPPALQRSLGEVAEAPIADLLQTMNAQTRSVLKHLFGAEAAHSALPEVELDISFDYTYLCEVSSFRVSVRGDAQVHAGVIVVPFLWLEAPRYMAALVHEVAHTYLSAAPIQTLLETERVEPWNPRAAAIVKSQGYLLAKLYRESGTTLAYVSPAGLLTEAVADLVALVSVGPHYLHTLLFSLIGLARVPEAPGDTRPAQSRTPTMVNPFVRIGALLRVATRLWPALDVDEVVSTREKVERVGYWKPGRLRPLLSICKAYFRLLEDAPDGQDRHLRYLFLREIDAVDDLFTGLLAHMKRSGWTPPVRVVEGQPGAAVATDGSGVVASAEETLFQAARKVSEEIWKTLKDMDAFVDPNAQPSWDWQRYLVHASGPSTSVELMKNNLIHLLWNSVLKRYPEATEKLLEAFGKGDLDAQRRIVERALWVRTPEVRLLRHLVDWAEEQDEREPESEVPRHALVLREKRPLAVRRRSLVEVFQIDCFWSERSEVGEWLRIFQHPQSYWAIGVYDLHLETTRQAGPERLDRAGESIFGRLPDRPQYTYLRGLDYIVVADPASGAAASEARSLPRAFLQLQITEGDGGKLDADGLVTRIEQWGRDCGAHVAAPVLRSFAWEHHALTIAFEGFAGLSRVWQRLRSTYRIRHHTMSILYRPEHSDANGERRPAESVGPRTLVPLRCELFDGGSGAWGRVVEMTSRFRCPAESGHRPTTTVFDRGRDALSDQRRRLLGQDAREDEGPLRLVLAPTTGPDHLELRVELWARGPLLDTARAQTLEALRVYRGLLNAVADATRAFDFQTTVRLPAPTEEERAWQGGK